MALAENPRTSSPPERSTITVDGVFDIETANWDQFIACALVIPGRKTLVWSWRKEEEAARALFALEGTYWAHNGGKFDFLWLIGWALRLGLKFRITLAGSAVAALHVGKAVFRDSYRLVPLSLDKGSEIGGVRKQKLGIPFDEVSRDMSRAKFFQLCDYMVQDCRALYAMLDALAVLAERHDIDLKSTIGASAWATVRRQGAPVADWGKRGLVTRDYRDARQAYYGGRTQVFRPISSGGYHYDLNSAYPAALSKLALPVGERTRVDAATASRLFASGKPGVFRAVVDVPRVFCPPLPVRARQRIGFPVGAFEGWWTGNELQAALSQGATVGSFLEGLVWSDAEMVLAPFCRHVWSLRDAAGKKTALGTFYKLLANSLTGKTASKPSREVITSDPDLPIFCPADFDCRSLLCGVRCCVHQCAGTCGKRTALVPGLPIFSRTVEGLSECSQVHWSAYLTAHTRAELARFAGGREDLVYCDTDSLFCEEPRSERIGSGLGEWALENTYQGFEALAPKTYLYADQDGVAHGASKGIHDAVRNFHQLGSGVVMDRGVNTFKTALRHGEIFKRRHLTRAIRPDGLHYGDRVLGPDGKTHPQTVQKLVGDFYQFGG